MSKNTRLFKKALKAAQNLREVLEALGEQVEDIYSFVYDLADDRDDLCNEALFIHGLLENNFKHGPDGLVECTPQDLAESFDSFAGSSED